MSSRLGDDSSEILAGNTTHTQAIEEVHHRSSNEDRRVGPVEMTESAAVQARDDASEKFSDMSTARILLILMGLGLCTFLFAIEQTIVATAVSDIGIGVNATGSLTWITTSYLLTTTVIQPITGRLSDVLGTKSLLIFEVWIFVIGNIIAGTAHDLTQLVAGRLISGVGGAGILSLATIIVSQLTHERQRGSYLNLINLVFIVADSLGPIIGGSLAKSGNWRWIFLLNAPFAPIITLVLMFAVRIQRSKPDSLDMRSAIRSFDSVGMFMLIATLTFLIVALNLAGDAFPWDSSVIIGLFVASAVGFVVFILIERRASKPIVPTHLFAQMKFRNVPIMTAVRCLLFFHLYATTFYVPIFLQVTGKSEVLAAALVIPFLLMAALASTVTNIIASTYGLVRPIFMAALAILPVGMGLMSTLNDKSPIGQVVGYTLISGLGFGSGTQLSIVIAQVGLGSDLLPTVTAFISATPNLGGVLGVGIVGTVINSAFRSNLSKHISNTGITLPHINDAVLASKDPIIGHYVVSAYVSAFKLGFQILAGIAALQFVLCLGLRRVELAGHTDSKENVVVENVDSEKTPAAVQEKETVTTKLEEV